MKKVSVTIASTHFDHFSDFRNGAVQAQGIEPIWLDLQTHEIFSRFVAKREWHVSELSFAKFVALATANDSDIIGLPVICSRMFRLSSLYVNTAKGIHSPSDLRGKRIGMPEWAQTAAVYTRGWIQHEVGVPLTDIEWVQAGTDDAGRLEKVELHLPKGLRLIQEPTKTLNGMLLSGELDAIMTARVPQPYLNNNPNIARLLAEPHAEEVKYFKRSGVYPIMHILAIRKDLLQEHPWIARNLYLAFEESRRRAMERIFQGGASRYPIPWLYETVLQLQELFKGDIFPYGIDANYTTLETFLRFCFEQGIADRLVKPEAIFPEGIEPSVKI